MAKSSLLKHKTHLIAVGFCVFSVSCQLTHHSIIARRWHRCDRWPQIFEFWVVRGFLHFLFKLITQRHEFNPSVVAMAGRILITVWMISFQVSLFFIIVKDPLCPFGHLTSVAQWTALPSLRHRLTFSQSSEGLVRPLWGEPLMCEVGCFPLGLRF